MYFQNREWHAPCRYLSVRSNQKMRLSSRLLTFSLPLLLILSGAALANNCNDFGSYTCSKSTPNIVRVGSEGSNIFSVSTTNGKGVGDTVIILAAFANGTPQGSINGVAFTSSLGAFENGSMGPVTASLGCGSCNNLSFGYVSLGTLGANGLSITASGLPAGTVLYAELVNSDGKIVYITPNSGAGIVGSTVPEPGALMLMGTGLLGIAAQIRRKLRG